MTERAVSRTFGPGWRPQPRAEVPARIDDRVPAPARLGPGHGDGREDARRDGGRRHVRPRRRRLSPLLGRRPLADPALREDALRQRAARLRLPARVVLSGVQVAPGRRGDARLRRGRAGAARRRARFGAGCRHRRRRGAAFTWNEREAAARSPRSCCSRSSTTASCSGVPIEPELRERLREIRAARPWPTSTTRRSPLGTASRWPRSPRSGLPPRAPRRRSLGRVAEFLLGPLSGEDGRLFRSWQDGRTSRPRRSPRRLPRTPPACSSSTLRRVRCAGCTKRVGSRCSRSSRSGDTSTASSWPSARRRPRRPDEAARRQPAPVGKLDAGVGAARLARIWGDDDLERRAAGVLRLVAPALTRAPGAFAWSLCASTSTSARRGNWRSPARSMHRSRARR